ncbi:glycerophosphodiester phosphodiesterase [Acetobacter fallax]|nr:glycerophosphodiester phosphodiesterase [Acetobacter fallax]
MIPVTGNAVVSVGRMSRRASLRLASGLLAGGAAMTTGRKAWAGAEPAAAEGGARWRTLDGSRPLLLAHRGASALRPEHTLAAYAKAIADGADYIEPDLVPTKDGALIARHDPDISQTTDVSAHPEFTSRRRTMVIDGETITGWFSPDFTLAEIKTLRARERLPKVRPQNARYDGQFDIPTLQEVIDFVAAESATRGRLIGVIPEIKHPTFFAGLGLPMEDRVLAVLGTHAYTRKAPLEIQCFEQGCLQSLHGKLAAAGVKARLMFLMGNPGGVPGDIAARGGRTTYADLMNPEALREIRRYAEAIGPANTSLIPRDAAGRWLEPTTLVRDAHAAGLLVHSYTCRPENLFLPAQLRSDAGPDARNEAGSVAEIRRYLAMGLDGFFTDDPAIGLRALEGLG